MKRRIAVPSLSPGGLDAERSTHFERCDCFTLIDQGGRRSRESKVHVVRNPASGEGHGLSPVNMLQGMKVDVVIVDEIDGFTLAALQFGGVEVYRGYGRLVATAVKDYQNRILPPIFYGSAPFTLGTAGA